MFEGNFVTVFDSLGNFGPTLSVFDVHPKNIARISGYAFRRVSWSWVHRTYEIRSAWIAENKLNDFRVAEAARVYFRDRPDITYRDPLQDPRIQRTEIFFDIYENKAWTNVWRYVFEYGELASLRSAFLASFQECVKFPWEITLPEIAHDSTL